MDLQAAVDFGNARPEWAPLPDTLQALGYTRTSSPPRPLSLTMTMGPDPLA